MRIVNEITGRFNAVLAGVLSVFFGKKTAERCVYQRETRSRLTVFAGMCSSAAYAAFQLWLMLWYSSAWSGAVAAYYLILAAARASLLRGAREAKKLGGCRGLRREYRAYRLTGVLLLLIDIAMAAVIVRMISENRAAAYHGAMIYVMAAYTAVTATLCVSSILKTRKLNLPVVSAARCVSLAAALMSALSLQAATLARYAPHISGRRFLNSITGGLVVFFVFGIAVYMVWHATLCLKCLDCRNKKTSE